MDVFAYEIQIDLAWIFRNCSTTKGANLFLITLELYICEKGGENDGKDHLKRVLKVPYEICIRRLTQSVYIISTNLESSNPHRQETVHSM